MTKDAENDVNILSAQFLRRLTSKEAFS